MSELGNLLKKSRKEKKMTLDELQQKTKIQKRYLEAIEQGNFSVLPGDFYTRAFIRTYAEVVGLDGDEIMATYRNELPSIKTEVNATDTTATREKQKKAPREVPAFLLGKGFKIVLAVMVVVIVGALWWMLYNKGQTSTDTVVDKSPATSISIDEANKSGESKVESSSKESESSDSKEDDEDAGDVKISAPDKDSESNVYEIEAPKSAKLKLVLDATSGDSWNSITSSTGESLESGLLASGNKQEVELSGQTSVNVTVGNSQALEVTIDGEKLTFASDSITQNITLNITQK